MSNLVHNYSKNPLALPMGPQGEKRTINPGQTIDLTDGHAEACAKDDGFKNWAKAKLIGPPPKVEEPVEPAPEPEPGTETTKTSGANDGGGGKDGAQDAAVQGDGGAKGTKGGAK